MGVAPTCRTAQGVCEGCRCVWGVASAESSRFGLWVHQKKEERGDYWLICHRRSAVQLGIILFLLSSFSFLFHLSFLIFLSSFSASSVLSLTSVFFLSLHFHFWFLFLYRRFWSSRMSENWGTTTKKAWTYLVFN